MSINACIYDSRRNLVGCITDSVIERFDDEFEALRKRHFGDDVTPILGIMEKSLIKSKDKMSADFLNCLKLLSRRHCDDAPVGFSQDVSKAYHALVRHCCSQQVYDEVLAETIRQFRDAGFDYIGANMNGFDSNDCLFEYNGKRIAIRMRERQDLYRMWNANDATGTHVVVTDGGNDYSESIVGSPMDVAEETIGFIEALEAKCMDESDILESLLMTIEALLAPQRTDD